MTMPQIAFEKIKSIAGAEKFLQALIDADLIYHCEEDAHDCLGGQLDEEECQMLNERMEECYAFGADFDPCKYVIDNA